ncbi:hypothetical protein GOBAR_AA09962 [Gossypium barbadense]|uniref:Uncharacterized protein n=1 Tax=Gossypium barbadense TaxID=3634 RepID=A0A2P5Y504_GOSBA|nr:hypothetical protein GOBAR_AA09962 [Gossypium barbadense]
MSSSRGTMSSSRGKKAAVPASKKKKGASSSSGPTVEVRYTFLRIIELTYLELTMELCSTFHLQTVMTNYADPGTVQFCLGGLVRQLNVPKFMLGRTSLGGATYNPSCSKASALSPSLRHVIDLAYFITLMIQHQTERHRKGVISIGPYVTRLARHFGLLSTAT